MHIEFFETMQGDYRLTRGPGELRPMSFTVRARSKALPAFLLDPRFFLEGEICAEGFADGRPTRGVLVFDLVRKRQLVYALSFEDNEGRFHRFEGEKNLSALSPIESMTVLPGRIFDADGEEEIGQARLRFDLGRDLGKFLGSFRARR